MVMQRERKSSDQILYLYIGRFFIYAYCFCIPISKAGSFLIQDLYDLDLTRTEQFWIFWAFSWLMQLNSINSFHTWQPKVYQSACCWNDAVGIMLKMGLYSVIRWQLQLLQLQLKRI
jgi:NADH-quinone oxidoreductase subunit M